MYAGPSTSEAGVYAGPSVNHMSTGPSRPMSQAAVGGGHGSTYSMAAYLADLKEGTEWLEDRMEHRLGMRSFIATHQSVDRSDYTHPERTLKSFVLSESESFSREAKAEWCKRNGHACVSLQHDGIVTGSLGGRQSQEVARGMQEAASHACGHEVQVKGELIWCDAAEDAGAPIWAE